MIEETPTFPSLAAYLDANLAPDALTSIASEEAEPLLESASMVVPDGETEQDVYTSTSAPVPISASEPPTPVPLQQFTPPTLPTPSMPPPGPTAPNPASTSGLEALLAQQMQLMSMQLAMLSGQAMPAQTQIPQVELPPVKSPPPQPSNIPPTPTQATQNGSVAQKSILPKDDKNKTEEQYKPQSSKEMKPFGAIARIETNKSDDLTPQQQQWLSEFINRYNAMTSKSKAFTAEHHAYMADPRVVSGFKSKIKELIYPIVASRTNGCRIWDLDGNEYVDALNGFGSNFFGYAHPKITQAVVDQLWLGTEIGPQNPLTGDVAKIICEMTGMERAAFCNTGSEAVMGAMRIARTVTGRKLIAIFTGSYHGIFDEVLVRGTKKLRSIPAAPGIMPSTVENVLVLDYGTEKSLQILRERAHELAAVMVEPIQSRRPDFQPREFLHEVRKITQDAECAFIFDEVITGFRMGPGGAQDFYGIDADIGTYGKVIGGGMSIGVVAGKAKWMDALDGGPWCYGDDSVPEVGVTYFAGTFVRHPAAIVACKAALEILQDEGPALQQRVNNQTQ
ncbi:aminotransferase class III-fold pyridoxal phosphate-dependent enzyme [Chloroflexi bacterium TSY]|nr:aminotransferase class III-fold pyridoxal phosphate-dependent enzyme [Chloroflexi bacterium TSY]